jgi:hypothetical protein
MMVHFENDRPVLRFQEDFFFDEAKKNKDGLAVINIYLSEKEHLSKPLHLMRSE